MMATRLLGSAHLLRLTHLRGSTLYLGSHHFLGFRNSLLQESTHVNSVCCRASDKWSKRIMAIVALFGSLGGLAAVGTYMLESPYISEILLRKGINKSQCSFQEPSKVVIERTGLQKDLKKYLDLNGYQPNPLTRVVCGPRGSGKTAAVMNLLKGRKGVVYVHIRDGGDDTDLAQQIHRALSVYVPKETDPTCLLETALQGTSRWYDAIFFRVKKTPHQPILVVDFNPRVDKKSFEDILFLLKSWGSDSGWIKPIVILTNTLGLERPRLGLRAQFFKIDDLSPKECESYHEKICEMIDGESTDQCKCKISKILPPNKWNRLLHLNTLAQNIFSSLDESKKEATQLEKETPLDEEATQLEKETLLDDHELKKEATRLERETPLDELKKEPTQLEQLKKEATRLEKEISDSYEKALISFTKEIEKKTKSKQHRVLCKLYLMTKEEKVNGKKVHLKEFCDEYGLPEKDIIEILLAIRPGPFYIHPETQQVYIGSKFMMPALERMCTPESTSTRKKF